MLPVDSPPVELLITIYRVRAKILVTNRPKCYEPKSTYSGSTDESGHASDLPKSKESLRSCGHVSADSAP